MNIRIPKGLVFFFSFLALLGLYWPAMSGTPIWDDFLYWFSDPVMKPEFSYITIWKNFTWPLSVTIQKFLFTFLDKKYFYYHMINLCLHFANSLLVYRLGRLLNLKSPMTYFFLFLVHPIAVITTAWMIQIKTLLCFFFGLSSFIAFIKGNTHFRWMILSWILFALSITSKSSSLTLPVIFLIIHIRSNRFARLYLLIPFFLIAFWSGYRLLSSPYTLSATSKAVQISKIKVPESKEADVTNEPLDELKVIEERPDEKQKTINVKEIPKKEVEINRVKDLLSFEFVRMDFELIIQTMNYYFWQAIFPIHTEPIKGPNFKKAGLEEAIHLFFLLMIIFIFRKDMGLIYLGAAHFLLLPFLGLIPAPYMNITWVSDQHLYLVIPALLAFWVKVLEKINWKYVYIVPVLFVSYFSYKTLKASTFYNNQFVFYEKSLEYNPYNIPIAYNLAFARLLNGEWNKAYGILKETYLLVDERPQMKKSIYYSYLVYILHQMDGGFKKNEN